MEFSGEVLGSDPAKVIRALYRHPRWVVGGALLVDARGVEAVTMTAADLPLIEAALHEVSAWRDGGRTAVLLRPATAEQLWRTIPELGPRVGRTVSFFHSLEEALDHLGRPAASPLMGLIAAAPSRRENGRRRA